MTEMIDVVVAEEEEGEWIKNISNIIELSFWLFIFSLLFSILPYVDFLKCC